jgi:hypothetical protein
MASLNNQVVRPFFSITKSITAATASVLGAKGAKEATTVIHQWRLKKSQNALVKVFERAANECAFIAQLTYEGSKALHDYDLTAKEKAALLSGDINWIETHLGKLDEGMSTWLRCRLQQEIW